MLMSFEKVTYTYPCNPKPTLQGLSLEITAGQRYAVIGQNGCGKTTLFRLANGLYRPSAGVVHWQSQPLQYDRSTLYQLRQQVGLVFQNPEEQLVAATVEEDLSYGLCNLGLPEADIARRVQQTLDAFELTDLADFPVNYLSLGQKKRLAIADIMILCPQLLLLDEPTAYLDPSQVRNLRQMLATIETEGTTLVIATHDLNFVEDWADWVVVMHQGQVVMADKPAVIFGHPHRLQTLGLR
ncbi:MAG: ABC transporter ATP-binding protein [Leptolyngbya sp. SIO1D8]|nr:ABC transporter ATP-binding protein [Leptolyngbya sp. SIO1D8]